MPYKDKNDPRYREYTNKRSQSVKDWRKRTKSKIVQSMGGCCQVCGYFKCDGALDLHHIDSSEKEFNFGRFMANPRALASVVDELRKCVLLCANCHRELHAGMIDLPENFSTLDVDKLMLR